MLKARKLKVLALLLFSFSFAQGQWLKNSEVYNFNIGDEFLTEGKYMQVRAGEWYPWDVHHIIIMQKWNGQNGALHYKRLIKEERSIYISNGFVKKSTYRHWYDTLTIANPNDSVSYNIYSHQGDSLVWDTTAIVYKNNTFGNRNCGVIRNSQGIPWNTPSNTTFEYIENCGGPFSLYNSLDPAGSFPYYYVLLAVKKGNIISGTFPSWTSWPVNILEELELDKPKIYPTISSGSFFIESVEPLERIRVFSISGKELKVINTPGTELQLDLLEAGTYFLKLEGKKETVVSKIIIQK